MASNENKTRATDASVDDFLAAVPDPTRRADAAVVAAMMQAATGEPAKLWGPSIVGFGSYHYRYDSGREGDMCLVGFSTRKSELVLYLVDGFEQREALLARLGKHRTGKSCLYIKRLSDVDLPTLRALIEASVRAMEPRRSR